MSRFQQVAVKRSIAELIEDYQTAERLVNDAYRMLRKADEVMGKYNINVKSHVHNHTNTHPCNVMHRPRRSAWLHLIDISGIKQIMDDKAASEFETQITKENPPAFDSETVAGTLKMHMESAQKMFDRGLVNVFSKLSGQYATNKKAAFKIPRKIIIRYVTESVFMGGLCVKSEAYGKINDLDRVIRTLDGKKFKEGDLISQLGRSWQESDVHDCQYYRAKAHINGNLHLEFKREDITERANQIIEEWYGATLGGLHK